MAIALCPRVATGDSPSGFYLGSLINGARELDVALQLEADGNRLSGSYYYFTRMPTSLDLRGTIGPKGAVTLRESRADGARTGLWIGTLTDGEFRGTWRDPKKGKSWSFRLVRSERATRYFEGAPRAVEVGSTGVLAYAVARVPNSEHRVPLITSFRDPKVITEVNKTLMGAAAAAHCEDEPDDHGFESEVTLATLDVLSIRIRESWFCQAAYPSTGDRSVTFDLRTARSIGRDGLFREGVTAEQVAQVLYPYELSVSHERHGTPKQAGQAAPEDECAEHWTLQRLAEAGFTYFHFTAEGLVVSPEFPHAIAHCANQVTVPFGALAPLAPPGGPMARLAAAHAGRPFRYRIHRPATPPERDLLYAPPVASVP